jgi:hypothetical protein
MLSSTARAGDLDDGGEEGEEMGMAVSKLATNHTYLSYGNRKDTIRGLQDIISEPVLTMRQVGGLPV